MSLPGTCQSCTQEFDWASDECPHCGWNRAEWVASGRYGLQSSP